MDCKATLNITNPIQLITGNRQKMLHSCLHLSKVVFESPNFPLKTIFHLLGSWSRPDRLQDVDTTGIISMLRHTLAHFPILSKKFMKVT